jgi:hypothetical protein
MMLRTIDLTFDQLVSLAGNRIGHNDIACPLCSAHRKRENRNKKVARVWNRGDFANLHCQRCGAKVSAWPDKTRLKSPEHLAKAQADSARSEAAYLATQLRKARFLYGISTPIKGTIAEIYLRECRKVSCPLPTLLRFLPPSGPGRLPAMIAPFGFPAEPEPGNLTLEPQKAAGVHLTFLREDGGAKAQTEDGKTKIMIGRSLGAPIVIAQANEGLGLLIAEGIEDALSAYQATGLGAWAAGAGGRMPALAGAVPSYIEAVTVMADADKTGMRGAQQLANAIRARGIEVKVIVPGEAAR